MPKDSMRRLLTLAYSVVLKANQLLGLGYYSEALEVSGLPLQKHLCWVWRQSWSLDEAIAEVNPPTMSHLGEKMPDRRSELLLFRQSREALFQSRPSTCCWDARYVTLVFFSLWLSTWFAQVTWWQLCLDLDRAFEYHENLLLSIFCLAFV